MVDCCQFIDVVLLNGKFECSGEEQKSMVSRWLRVVGEVDDALLLFRATSWLRIWLIGVLLKIRKTKLEKLQLLSCFSDTVEGRHCLCDKTNRG